MKRLSAEASRALEVVAWTVLLVAVGPLVILGVLLAAILGGPRR